MGVARDLEASVAGPTAPGRVAPGRGRRLLPAALALSGFAAGRPGRGRLGRGAFHRAAGARFAGSGFGSEIFHAMSPDINRGRALRVAELKERTSSMRGWGRRWATSWPCRREARQGAPVTKTLPVRLLLRRLIHPGSAPHNRWRKIFFASARRGPVSPMRVPSVGPQMRPDQARRA